MGVAGGGGRLTFGGEEYQHLRVKLAQDCDVSGGPPPCNSGITGI